jgi:broad specificity phosphatase PhoE
MCNNKSKYFIKILLFLGFSHIFIACQNSQRKSASFILIRHAEKILSSSNDPHLSTKGWQRANELVHIFKAVDIDAVYASPYRRSIDTAKPLAKAKQLGILNYNPSELDSFAQKLLNTHMGETVIIVGHSNTTPQLINALSGTKYPNLDETEYDWVYFVDISPKGTPNVKKIQIRM